jgi:hypothetical protein
VNVEVKFHEKLLKIYLVKASGFACVKKHRKNVKNRRKRVRQNGAKKSVFWSKKPHFSGVDLGTHRFI